VATKAPQQLEDLKLSEAQAEAVIEKAIEYEAHSDAMPDSKKDKLAAVQEILSLCIDAYVNDNITSDDEDSDIAETGAQIEEIMALAGVEIEDGEPVFSDPPEAGGDDNGGDTAEGDEGPFDPDDYIEGYSSLSALTKLKKVKELDADDEEDAGLLEDIADWEEAQDKPSSRVLAYIEEVLGEEVEGEPEPEDADDADEPEAEEVEAGEEPWEGYDKTTAVNVKKVLQDQMDDEDDPLSREQVEYVLEYESTREKPAPRKRIIDFCKALLEQFDNGGDPAEDEPEDEPVVKRGSGRGKNLAAKRAAKAASSNGSGSVTLTREQILTALDLGEVTIEL
jgi:hypothetical protein